MTRDEADALAKRIINCWRGGPPLEEWRAELERLDAGTAGTTYARLKRSLEHAPSIARFLSEYKTIDTDDASTRERCGECGGSGWVAGQSSFVKSGHVYSHALPCLSCPAGAAAGASRLFRDAPEYDLISNEEADRLLAALRESA